MKVVPFRLRLLIKIWSFLFGVISLSKRAALWVLNNFSFHIHFLLQLWPALRATSYTDIKSFTGTLTDNFEVASPLCVLVKTTPTSAGENIQTGEKKGGNPDWNFIPL